MEDVRNGGPAETEARVASSRTPATPAEEALFEVVPLLSLIAALACAALALYHANAPPGPAAGIPGDPGGTTPELAHAAQEARLAWLWAVNVPAFLALAAITKLRRRRDSR